MNRVLNVYREISYALLFLMYANSAVPAYKEFAKRLIWDTAITRCGKYQCRDLIIYRFPLVYVSAYNHILPCLIKFHYWCTNECSGLILHNLQDSWSWCACSPKVRMRTLGMHEKKDTERWGINNSCGCKCTAPSVSFPWVPVTRQRS